MKLALIGNCQLEVLGDLIKDNPALYEGKFTYVYNNPLYKLDEKRDMINLYHELEQCDAIFMQFHSEKWGVFSTATLRKYFDLTILPTLESRISCSQLDYFDAPLPDLMIYIDYRLLHLYLTSHDVSQAVKCYHQAAFSEKKQLRMLEEDTKKYKVLFQQGMVYFDYSEDYFHSLSKNTGSYSTVSHPNNENLGLLLSAIYNKTYNLDEKFSLQGNEMLLNYVAPRLGSGDISYFMMRQSSLSLATKINYAFFESQDKEKLKSSLLKSAYYHSLKDRFMNV